MKQLALSLYLVFVTISFTNAIYSGLYVDNGYDQTVISRAITRREKLKFEREMLNVLGISRKPRRSFNASALETSAPKFMLDIYNSLNQDDDLNVPSEFSIREDDIRTVKESDSIMTFLSRNKHVSSVRHERGKRLWFDVSDVPLTDTMVNAEMRLYKIAQNGSDASVTYVIAVYQVLLDYAGEKELELVDSVNTTLDYEGWLVFNVSSPIMSWVVLPSTNRGVYVSVHKYRSAHELHPDAVGIISSVSDEFESQQPFMVAYLKYGANSKPKIRRIRDAPSRITRKTDGDVSFASTPFSTEATFTTRNCQLQSLYVNFKDLNWHEWIIAPDGYAAYYCSGLCDFPLNARMNATNHAIVQTLVHLINPADAPKPCCAPTKLGNIAVLYYLEDNNVILKKYRNMIVKSCGCH